MIKAIGRRIGLPKPPRKDQTWQERILPEISRVRLALCSESSNVCVVWACSNRAPQGGPHMSFDAKLKVAKISRGTIMERRPPAVGREALAAEIASLSKLDTDELRARWKAMFGNPPSRDISRSFLKRAIAYRLQEKVFGGLKPSTQRLLEEFTDDRADGSAVAAAPSRIVQLGALLVREWRGISHQVSVLEKGFCFRGKRYRSLSEVAREITGTRWSGPLFFGLKRRSKEAANG